VPLPAARPAHDGDSVRIELWSDASSGEKLADLVRIGQSAQARAMQVLRQQMALMAPSRTSFPSRPIPTVSGDARPYSAEDAEIHLVQPRISVNGEKQADVGRSANISGTLVWFYLPKHGRYILSLAPRAGLGFVKTGEIRGGALTFTDGNDKFLIESPNAVTTGEAPYFLYVLHDPEWEPTARNQADRAQFGSVAPGELALLQKK